jgi:spermidine/putrescine transport system ATP-binding protein
LKGSDVSVGSIYKSFGDFDVLKNVSLDIKKGEFFSLLGPSGCGKTTLLRIIAGFEMPDEGTLKFDGVNVLPVPPNRRQVNTIFQNYALFPHLTVFENVAFPLRIKHAPRDEINSKVHDYLKLVQLEGHSQKKTNQLSGGQKQRVAIARALIMEPHVLLLDEPLSALDAKLRQHMLIELDQIHDKIGITFIYVTHDQQEALSVSDRIAVLDQGEALQVGTPHDIYESPSTGFVASFIGETNLFDGNVLTVEKIDAPQPEYMVELDIPGLGRIKVTTVDDVKAGQEVSFTVRPEKIVISTEKPVTKRADINMLQGVVDEPIYSGFQTKYYIKTRNAAGGASCAGGISNTDSASSNDDSSAGAPLFIRVIKQHARYSDEGPDIVWRDEVYLSWSAHDGYIVCIKDDVDVR